MSRSKERIFQLRSTQLANIEFYHEGKSFIQSCEIDAFSVSFSCVFSFRFRSLQLQSSAWLSHACCHFLKERLVFYRHFPSLRRSRQQSVLNLLTKLQAVNSLGNAEYYLPCCYHKYFDGTLNANCKLFVLSLILPAECRILFFRYLSYGPSLCTGRCEFNLLTFESGLKKNKSFV